MSKRRSQNKKVCIGVERGRSWREKHQYGEPGGGGKVCTGGKERGVGRRDTKMESQEAVKLNKRMKE